ncbi:hypothetical protein DZF91_37120 [Actinomadura logoneensis]|uniref:Uncharacterized protein n=1 Tax=Actinomadura logoneensis TaxID=2293572 RepID=A0A372J9G0_9ACTN|nr:hypothetical protein DZF91_37120 [Actinomadura logoneensis]
MSRSSAGFVGSAWTCRYVIPLSQTGKVLVPVPLSRRGEIRAGSGEPSRRKAASSLADAGVGGRPRYPVQDRPSGRLHCPTSCQPRIE